MARTPQESHRNQEGLQAFLQERVQSGSLHNCCRRASTVAWRAPAPRAAATCGGARGLLGFPRMRAGRGARRAESRARAPLFTCRGRHRGRATRVARALRQHRWSPPRPGRAKVTPDEPLPCRLRVPEAREAAKCMHILLSVCLSGHLGGTHLHFVALAL